MITIYRAEEELTDLILGNTSIAYQHEMSPLSSNIAQKEKIKAGLVDRFDGMLDLPVKGGERDSDLHYVQSLLVTTNWNKNDDVFDVQEVWNARHTPQHKPTNVGHDEHEIVGHMTANWVIDEDGNWIDDNTSLDNLPSLFHVINGSVIYKAFQDEKLLSRADRLIEDIDAGRKFVSMECIFTGFDYAVLSPDNTSRVIARNEETAFLTKHLRAYGGVGIYDGFKIGRLLRNITFTGKGFVDKPANPNSIIFDKDKFFNFANIQTQKTFSALSNINGVSIIADTKNQSNEENFMTEFMQEQNSVLKARVDELDQKLVEANQKLAKSSVEKFEKNIAKLEEELKTSHVSVDELKVEVAQHAEKAADMTKELEELKLVRNKLQSEMDEVKASELKTNRISILVDGNIDKEVAETKVDLYASLSDEQFADLASELIQASKIKNAVNTDSDDSDDVSSADDATDNVDSIDVSDDEVDDADAATDVLDNVEPVADADLSTANTEQSDNDIRLKLSRAIASRLNLKMDSDDDNSKGEN